MSSRIANRANDSSDQPDSKSASASALSHVEIVPSEAGGESGSSANRHVLRVSPPDQQQETVISKQNTGPGNEVSASAAATPHPAAVPPPLPFASTPYEMGARLVGSDLGHFRLEEFVGGGGMGAVFRATDVRLGRTVAVKVLSRDRTDADTLRRFQNEAQSAARLDHQNIARVYYVGEDRGLHYIVFEFIEGTNVRDLVQQKGPLPLEEAINYVLQVAEALEHASLRNVIHRDIKPSNVLVTREHRAKLVDMGLARLHAMDSEVDDLTASGVTLGTFDYISPEQARDPRTADVRSDLYSLGCTFYFMLTGRPPFPQGTMLQKLLSHSSDPPLDPRTFRPDLDEQVVQVVERLLAKQPGRRFQRPSELIGQLLLMAERLDMQTIARNGAVWIATRQTLFSRVSGVVPWALPLLLFLMFVPLVRGRWPAREPFEFQQMTVHLQTPVLNAAVTEDAEDLEEPPSETPDLPHPDVSPDVPTRLNGETAENGETGAPKPPATAPADPPAQKVPEDTTPDAESARETRPGDPPPDQLPALAYRPPLPRIPPRKTPDLAEPETPETEVQPEPPTDTNDSDSATQPPARIVVSDEPEQLAEDDVLAVATLSEACRKAQQWGTKVIELHYNGQREETPIELGSGEVTISRGAGFQPEVVFRPTYNDPIFGRSMIRANGSRLTWRGVHVLLDLTDAPQQSWSLFRLRSFVDLEVRDAVLTIRNVDSRGETRHTPVDFFVLEPEPTAEISAEETRVPSRLRLTDCILRGQANVVQAESHSVFRLVLQNSLVVARGWLFQIAESSSSSHAVAGSAEVVLEHVTAVLREGLGRVAGRSSPSDALELAVQTSDSMIQLTGPQGTLFEWIGVQEPSDMETWWRLEGRDNIYGGVNQFLKLRSGTPDSDWLVVDFDSLDQLSFLDERRPRFQIPWEHPASELTEDLQSSELYQPGTPVGEEQGIEEADTHGETATEDAVRPGADPHRLPTQLDLPSEKVTDPEND